MKQIRFRSFGSALWIIAVAVGSTSLVAQTAPEVIAWGDNQYYQTNVPSGLSNLVAISAGGVHNLALTAEGQVLAWGAGTTNAGSWPDYGQSQVPSGLSNVVAISAGEAHSLALTADGQVVAWGAGITNSGTFEWDFGQSQVPVGLSNVVAIAAGARHSLALTDQGQVVSWGALDQASVPNGLSNVVAIAAGGSHSLALTPEGRVVAWGLNGGGCADWTGQATVPVGLSNVVAIAAGRYHSLALTADGRVVSWGDNAYGQTAVPGSLSNVVAIAAGDYHSLALTAEGRVVAWGFNMRPYAPVPVWTGQATVPTGLSNAVEIAAGGYHSLVLSGLSAGAALPLIISPRLAVATASRPFRFRTLVKNGATGYGAAGLPLGLEMDPQTGLISGSPVQPGTYSVVLSATNSTGSITWAVTLYVNEPAAPVAASSGIVLAGYGSAFNYSVDSYNVPEWFGASGLPPGLVIDPQSGLISGVPMELGDFPVTLAVSNRYGFTTGAITLRVTPLIAWGEHWLDVSYYETNVPAGLSNIVAVSAGFGFSLALTGEERVVAWGYNATDVPRGLSNVVAISAGGYHSLALKADGTVVAWGDNGSGQTNVPSGLSNVVAIAAGVYTAEYSLALTAEGRVVAWGGGNCTNVPAGLKDVVSIAAGDRYALALTKQGRVIAWGFDLSGDRGLSNVVAIAAGYYCDLALTADGRVVQWTAGEGYPEVPKGLSNVVEIAAGYWHSLALTSDGTVVCWGLSGPNTMVPGTKAIAIAGGFDHSIALAAQTLPTPRLGLSRGTSELELRAHGAQGISCLLLQAPSLRGPWLPAQPVTFTNTVQMLGTPDTATEPAQFFRLLRK